MPNRGHMMARYVKRKSAILLVRVYGERKRDFVGHTFGPEDFLSTGREWRSGPQAHAQPEERACSSGVSEPLSVRAPSRGFVMQAGSAATSGCFERPTERGIRSWAAGTLRRLCWDTAFSWRDPVPDMPRSTVGLDQVCTDPIFRICATTGLRRPRPSRRTDALGDAECEALERRSARAVPATCGRARAHGRFRCNYSDSFPNRSHMSKPGWKSHGERGLLH